MKDINLEENIFMTNKTLPQRLTSVLNSNPPSQQLATLLLVAIICFTPFLLLANNIESAMKQQNHDIEAIKEEFAKSFIEAISSKSVEACADLVLNAEDNKTLEIDYGFSDKVYRKKLMTQSKNFLKEQRKFIDKMNADQTSAISYENYLKINTYDFEIPKEHPACFIKTISISMKERLIDGVFYQVGFQIDDALFINGKIKINNLFSVRMYESYRDEINEENTPYPLVKDKKILRNALGKHANKEYADILGYYNDWYLHEGDLTIEKFDLKVNLIVTGNLTIKEPVVEVPHELIVLGKTQLNTLYLNEPNDVLFLGGIEFKDCLFIMDSGPYQIFNHPKGPLIFSWSESIEVNSLEQVECCPASELGEKGDVSELLLEAFYSKNKEDGIYELKLELILETLRAGKSIFK